MWYFIEKKFSFIPCKFSSHFPFVLRSVGFTGEASEAVHYALHYLRPLLNFEENERTNGFIAKDQVIRPRLKLPDVFELLHHMNQVTPMLALEAVLGMILRKLALSYMALCLEKGGV